MVLTVIKVHTVQMSNVLVAKWIVECLEPENETV